MEILGIHIIVVGVVLFILNLIGKVRMKSIIDQGYSTIGIVTGYENKFMRVGGAWTWLDYPTVEYTDRQKNQRTGFIKYAKSTGRYFSIGQEVEIVVDSGTIYYKHAMNSMNLRWIAIILILAGIGKVIYENWIV